MEVSTHIAGPMMTTSSAGMRLPTLTLTEYIMISRKRESRK